MELIITMAIVALIGYYTYRVIRKSIISTSKGECSSSCSSSCNSCPLNK